MPAAFNDPTALTPTQVETAYDIRRSPLQVPPVDQGVGQIGIINFASTTPVFSDARAFWGREGIPHQPAITATYSSQGSTICGDVVEADIDVEWSGAIAPNVSGINIMEESNTLANYFDELNYFANNPGQASAAISASWGVVEDSLGSSMQSVESSFSNAVNADAAAGLTLVAAAGECSGPCPSGSLPPVGIPAAIDRVQGVGGTVLATPTSTVGETAWDSTYAGRDVLSGKAVSWISLVSGNAFQLIFNGQPLDDYEGTSFAAPIWSGIYADAYQYAGRPVTSDRAGRLYTTSGVMHDVTSRCSGTLCAGPGFDYVTGFGSTERSTSSRPTNPSTEPGTPKPQPSYLAALAIRSSQPLSWNT
jgi:subtilase family serine protease